MHLKIIKEVVDKIYLIVQISLQRINQSEINNLNDIYNKLKSVDYNEKLSNLLYNKDKFNLLGVQNYVYTKILNKLKNG